MRSTLHKCPSKTMAVDEDGRSVNAVEIFNLHTHSHTNAFVWQCPIEAAHAALINCSLDIRTMATMPCLPGRNLYMNVEATTKWGAQTSSRLKSISVFVIYSNCFSAFSKNHSWKDKTVHLRDEGQSTGAKAKKLQLPQSRPQLPPKHDIWLSVY